MLKPASTSLLLLLLTVVVAFAERPLAFPGAAGFGRHAQGARGGSNPDVYIVDSLADDGSPGTLRHAVESVESGKGRFIVFSVGGVIVLEQARPLILDKPYLTIAGQTAPRGGICIVGEGIFVQSHDIIVRGLRVRPGDYHSTDPGPTNERDGMKIGRGQADDPPIRDIIIDHCSFSWSVDEIVSAYSACRNVTFQYNLFAEALHDSIQNKENRPPWGNVPHGMGPLVGPGAQRVSRYRNVTAHCNRRNPMIKGPDEVEIVNNLFYNWGPQAVLLVDDPGGHRLKAHFVGNVWRGGPDSFTEKSRFIETSGLEPDNGSEVFWSDNAAEFGSHRLRPDENPFVAGFTKEGGGDALAAVVRRQPVFPGIPSSDVVTPGESGRGLDFLLDEVGARWPMRDAIDARIIADIGRRTGSVIDVVYLEPGKVPGKWLNAVGSRVAPDVDQDGDPKLPDYGASGDEARPDTDRDGIPDAMESRFGQEPLADDDGDGFLNIEEYLNSLIAG